MPDYPALDKSWNFNVNQALAAQGSTLACNQNLLYQWANTLIGLGWQVRGSSNSVAFNLLALAAAGPGTGWSGPSSVVFGNAGSSTPCSWIVLRNTALGPGHPEIMITGINRYNGGSTDFYVSPSAGFTGGGVTVSTLPTATDGFRPSSGGLDNVGYGTVNLNTAYAMHGEASTDGQCTRVWVFQGGSFQQIWILDRHKNPVSGWTSPWTFTTYYPATIPAISGVSPSYGMAPNNLLMNFWWTGEGANGSLITTLYNAANDLNGEYPMVPIGLYAAPAVGSANPGRSGRHGMFYDLWWGVAALASGQTYGGAAPHAFVQVNTQIFPWSGAATMNTS